MPNRRWVYTSGGKPLPGGPVEVEPVRRSHSRDEKEPQAPKKPQQPGPGEWTDFVPPEDER